MSMVVVILKCQVGNGDGDGWRLDASDGDTSLIFRTPLYHVLRMHLNHSPLLYYNT